MGFIASKEPRLREALIGRLLRQVLDRHETDASVHDVLRTCAGIAQAEDLNDAELQWLMSAVEAGLGISLHGI